MDITEESLIRSFAILGGCSLSSSISYLRCLLKSSWPFSKKVKMLLVGANDQTIYDQCLVMSTLHIKKQKHCWLLQFSSIYSKMSFDSENSAEYLPTAKWKHMETSAFVLQMIPRKPAVHFSSNSFRWHDDAGQWILYVESLRTKKIQRLQQYYQYHLLHILGRHWQKVSHGGPVR